MKFLSRLNRPWLHFIVLGVLLFYLQARIFRNRSRWSARWVRR